jgi:phosphatidyl-myo-inositol dimannoside synthase
MSTLLFSELFPPRVGGTARWFYEVYRRYPKGEARIFTDYQAGDHEVDGQLSLPITRTPMKMEDWGFLRFNSIKQYWRTVRALREIVRNQGVQKIHCARVMPEGVAAFLAYTIWRTPYCVYAHGEEIGTALSSSQLTLLMRWVYGSAHKIIANSRNTRTLLQKVGVQEEKIAVIPPGVDIIRFSPGDEDSAREMLGLTGHPILLSVGRLQRRKGHDHMIRAVPAIAAKFPNLKYVIVGTGEEESRLRRIADEAGIAHLVKFAGSIADDHLTDYYRACDLFVLPNREEANHDIEGFGIVFLEANACGKPVLGGISGGTRDAIADGETGLLVDGENVQAISEAALSILETPGKAAAMGYRGRERTVALFSWEKGAERIRQLG